MSLDNLLKGLSVFQDGMLAMGKQQAITAANKKLTEINNAGLKEADRVKEATQLSSQLAMRLAGLGATGTEINAATSFAPSASAQFQIQSQKEMQHDSQMFQSGEAQKQRTFTAGENQKTRDNNLAIAGLKSAAGNVANSLPAGLSAMAGTKITAKDVESVKGAKQYGSNIFSSLQTLRGQVKQHGTEVFSMFTSDSRNMKRTVRDLQLSMKEVANLGVLTGPDMGILEDIIPDPTTAKYAKPGGNEEFMNDLTLFENTLTDKVANNLRARNVTSPGLALYDQMKAAEAILSDPDQVKKLDPAKITSLKAAVQSIRQRIKKDMFGALK